MRLLQRATTRTLGLKEIVRIRDVVPQDAEKLLAFRQKLFGETDFMLYGPGEYSATVGEVASQVDRMSHVPTSRSLIAEHYDKFVGFLGIIGSPVPRLRHSVHLALGVLREWWSHGVATDLMNEVFRWAPTVGVSRLELS